MIELSEIRPAVIGLGYVGLPLAVEFGQRRSVVGFDINEHRIAELSSGIDTTLELTRNEIESAKHLRFTSDQRKLRDRNCFIITVPTPIDNDRKPDLSALRYATETVARVLKFDDIVIYESTVYPGCTEEFCVPILEKISGLRFNESFYCGYSPERINPGDKEHRLKDIIKVTSGSTFEVADLINNLYGEIISAGTYLAESIKVAEAAKVIENTQRDLNIALVNEIAIIFNKLNIDTGSVLRAAGTKWNFLPFRPGLVGGHCIGVDPYYLTHKALQIGYTPEVILAGRKLNDGMGTYVASTLVEEMARKGIEANGSSVLILGFTFKENCPDIRNTRVIDIYKELNDYGAVVSIFDPWVEINHVSSEYDLIPKIDSELGSYDGIIIAVAHDQFKSLTAEKIKQLRNKSSVVYDLKNVLKEELVDIRL
ncbi:Vi polysaccharide biosynthesis UDP-N-acetylglucosamine C-6 dehydrogenase TviB [Planktomarina temperata]|nr:Vi polysaccharide biosynthesis UDP-N-acetylglucosamine C-6 dehydrogenase TviB [bacterium]MDB2458924.1 Vi polysaccharide biosynthesis UDP-N-acetylglucosamine C-6 dehydrogenase TviB [Planktomarina temperata]